MSIDHPFAGEKTVRDDALEQRLRCDAKAIAAVSGCPPPPTWSALRRLEQGRRKSRLARVAAILALGIGIASIPILRDQTEEMTAAETVQNSVRGPAMEALDKLRSEGLYLEAGLSSGENELQVETQRIAADVRRLRDLVATQVDRVRPLGRGVNEGEG